MFIFMAPRSKMMAQTCPQEGQEREYKRRISKKKSQKSSENHGFYGQLIFIKIFRVPSSDKYDGKMVEI